MSVHQEYKVTIARLAQKPSHDATMAALLLGATTSFIAALFFARAPIALPSVSLLSLLMAGLVATTAWLTRARREGRHITLWDLSGAYAFVGFAAGMLSEPTQVMELMALPPDLSAEAR